MTDLDFNQIPHPRDCHRVPEGATMSSAHKDPIIDRLDAMKALTRSSSIPLGVPIATHIDGLLRDTWKELQRAVEALRVVHEHSGIADYCTAPCTHGDCEVSRAIAEALEVRND